MANSLLDIPGASGLSPREAAIAGPKTQVDPITRILAQYVQQQAEQQKALQAAQNPALNKSVLEDAVEKTVGGMLSAGLGALQGAMPQMGAPAPQGMPPAPQGMPPAQGGIGGLDFAPAQMADGGIVGYNDGGDTGLSEAELRELEMLRAREARDNAAIRQANRGPLGTYPGARPISLTEQDATQFSQRKSLQRLREKYAGTTGGGGTTDILASATAAADTPDAVAPTAAATPTPTPSGATAEDLTSPYTKGNYVPLGPGIEATARQVVPGVTVTSRGRTAKKNASVRGVAGSYHLLDSARDFIPGNSGLSMSQLEARLKETFGPDFDVINEGDHIHVEPGPKMGAQLRAEAEGAGLPTTEEGISRLEAVRSGRAVMQTGLERENFVTDAMIAAATPKLDYDAARDLLEEMAPRSTEAREALKELIAKGEDQAPSEIQRALAGLGDVFAQVGEQRLSPIEALFAGVGSGFKTRLAGREGEREAALERAKLLADMEQAEEASALDRAAVQRDVAKEQQGDTARENMMVQFGIKDMDFMREFRLAMEEAKTKGNTAALEDMLKAAQFNYEQALRQVEDLGSRTDDNARTARANLIEATGQLRILQRAGGLPEIADPAVALGDLTTFISEAEKAGGSGQGDMNFSDLPPGG